MIQEDLDRPAIPRASPNDGGAAVAKTKAEEKTYATDHVDSPQPPHSGTIADAKTSSQTTSQHL